jgi:AGZA family xanthine/uracil permease-like MFS transporter
VATANGGVLAPVERYFRLRSLNTSIPTELLAGLTTFMVMAYIIAVNPATLVGLDTTQVATSTCLVAGVMSIAMGLYTNRAIAIAPGLGLNAIVSFTLVGSMGLTYPQAMGVVVAEGIIITVLVLTGVRRLVLDIVPMQLKQAISVGIGFFILFIGLKNAGVITFITGTDAPVGTFTGFVELSPLNSWSIFVTVVGLAIMVALVTQSIPGAILWGILAGTAIAFIVPGDVAAMPDDPLSGPDFGLLGEFSFGFIGELGILTALLVVLSLMLADFFDTMGTLIAVGGQAGYLTDRGELPEADKPLLVDALAAVAGGVASSSSATSYIESASGVSVGGRSGLVSVTTGALFLLSLPFVALVSAIPAAATAPALIVVGVLMVSVLAERTINFANIEDALPVVLTVLMMPFTFNITNGIGAGFVSYVFVKLVSGKARQVHPGLYLVAGAFLLYFLRWALFDAEF